MPDPCAPRYATPVPLLSLFSSVALAASSAEPAVYAWADKCPSTAMRAGVYTGRDFAAVSSGGRTVHRFRSDQPKGGDLLRAQSTLWMLMDSCRAVGLVRLGDPELQPGLAHLGFVVAKDGGVPTEAEQATLLAWAGMRAVDPADPSHAVAAAALAAPPAPESTPYGALVRRAPRVWREGAVPAQVEAWRAGGEPPSGAICPCWTVFSPGTPSKTERRPYVAQHFGVAGTVTLLEDPAGRWTVEPAPPFFVDGGGRLRAADVDALVRPIAGAPPAALTALEHGWWTHTGMLAVALRDPDTGASLVLSVPVPDGTVNAQALWAASGLAFPGQAGPVPSETLLGWLR
jgi:hypothetical protein